jgi:hypothetical protein
MRMAAGDGQGDDGRQATQADFQDSMRAAEERTQSLQLQLLEQKNAVLEDQLAALQAAREQGPVAMEKAATITATATGTTIGKMATAAAVVLAEVTVEAAAQKKSLVSIGAKMLDDDYATLLMDGVAQQRVPSLQSYPWVKGLDAVRFPTSRADGRVEAGDPEMASTVTDVSKSVSAPKPVREFATFDRERVRAMEHTIAESFVIPRMQSKGFDIPSPTVQAAPGLGGQKQRMRYDLPRQPHLDPDDQPGIEESIQASNLPRSAKAAVKEIYGNVNRRYVHLETWIRISLNEMLTHFKSDGDDDTTVRKCMAIIRLALRQYRQTALAETQVVLGVIDPPSNGKRTGVPLLSVSSAVAAAKSMNSKERTVKHLADGPESKRARVDSEGDSTSRGGEHTGASPNTGGRAVDTNGGNLNAGRDRAGGVGDDASKN